MRHALSFVVFSLLAGVTAAHANTLQTFDVSAVLDPNTGTGGAVTGTIAIDTTAGTYSSSSLSSVYGATTYSVSSVETTFATKYGGLVILSFGSPSEPQNAFLSLVLPTTTLVNYGGGSVCTDVARCSEAGNSNYTSSYFAPGATFGDGLTTGTLTLRVVPPPPTPVAATPEPASMALLGTGMLGLAGVVRRRLQ